jgi:predicted nucleic acid-binding protein
VIRSVTGAEVDEMFAREDLASRRQYLSGHCSIQRAFEISDELLADRRVFFEYEPRELETAWAALMQHPAARASSWTDAYLAAFARKHDYEMATFDRGFKRWADLKLSLLDQPAL